MPSRRVVDPVAREVTLQAPERRSRPQGASAGCPFCPGAEAGTPPETDRAPASGPWMARSFSNAFPLLPFHEVVVDTPRHVARLDELDAGEVAAAVHVWARRLSAARHAGAFPILWRNDGARAGASLPHAHAQVGASADPLPRLQREAQSFASGCAFEDPAHWTVVEDQGAMRVLEPRASRFPGEAWVAPRVHAARFEEESAPVREEFAAALLAAVRRAAATVEGYNVVIHTAPTGEDFHWHAEVLPRRDPLAGLELGAGVFVNAGP